MYVINLKKSNKSLKVSHVSENLRITKVSRPILIKKVGGKGEKGDQGLQGLTGEGLPTGGTDGQVLHKASNADYDLEWKTPSFEDKNFTLNFTVLDTVLVQHNLHKYPAVTVVNSAGDTVIGGVEYLDDDALLITFSAPFSGRVICN